MIYAGRVLTGNEAQYVLAARGAAQKHDGTAESNLTHDERIADLMAMLLASGIGPDEFSRMTLDQIDLFQEGRKIRIERQNEKIELTLARAQQNKSEPLLRYTVPLE